MDQQAQQAMAVAQGGAQLAGRGDFAGALAAYQEAVRLWPGFAEGHASVGSLLRMLGRREEALGPIREGVRLKPAFAECRFLLGSLLLELGRLAEAEAEFRTLLSQVPGHVEAWNSLGAVYKTHGALPQALACFGEAVRLNPAFAVGIANQGATLEAMGRYEEALACHTRAVGLMPSHPDMQLRLGATLAALGRHAEALVAYERSAALSPAYDVFNHMGISLRMLARVDEAAEAFRRATELAPPSGAQASEAWSNRGVLLDLKGERAEALRCHRQAVAADPQSVHALDNLLYALHFHPAVTPRELLAEHRVWEERFGAPLRQQWRPHANAPAATGARAPGRRLRVGYVSPDFRDHPVGRFMVPLISGHDAGTVEVSCYADEGGAPGDPVTEAIRRAAAHWRRINGMDDAAVADLVRRDEIDVLVDLTMHMAGNRLGIFARRPAPVQVTYLAYCSTTGLAAMDYRLSDPYLDPVDEDMSIYSEETVRLGQYWCYGASALAPAVAELPCARNGSGRGVTFGCLNGFVKVSDQALAAWAEILRAVPGSRLMLHANPGSHRERVWRLLEGMGVARGRCEFVGLGGLAEYFSLYGRMDVALDPFPYAGGTTTCDALWMGVPVVTLRGDRAVGRGGVSILSTLAGGTQRWIAGTVQEYVGIACTLARDVEGLRQWRGSLRDRMRESRLMDGKVFARGVEAAFQNIWTQSRGR